jgi:hypothetical protein
MKSAMVSATGIMSHALVQHLQDLLLRPVMKYEYT